MRWRGFLAAVAVCAAVAAVGVSPALAATTWTVDQTTGNDILCPITHNCKTIQAAINFAANGDTILVHDGVYDESIVINKELKLKGDTRPTLISGCSPTTAYSPTLDTVIHHTVGFTTYSVDIESSNVTMTGFVIRHAQWGIVIDLATQSGSFGGISINKNMFQEHEDAIFPDFNGSAPNSIQQNCFRNNTQDAIGSGWGAGKNQNLRIAGNKFRNNVYASIVLAAPTQDNVEISGNIANGDGMFLGAINLTNFQVNGNIANNVKTGPTAEKAALHFGGAVTNGTIQGNIFSKGTHRGMFFNKNYVPTANSGLTITGNVVNGFAGNGLDAGPGGLKTSTITGNIAKVTGVNGLLLGGGNTGNSFAGNIFEGTTWGCHSFTAAALNNWNGNSNIGKPMNTPGTCFP
jgi:hypothetical protein